MRVELGGLISALSGWVLCVDECGDGCSVCAWLPGWARGLGRGAATYAALYLAARATMDHRVAAAMHIHASRERVAMEPEMPARLLRESKVVSRIPIAIEEECPHAWDAVLLRGLIYAQAVLSLDRPVVVAIQPPEDRRRRERLRRALEGRRGEPGLIGRLEGRRLAPWIYVVPRRALPELRRRLANHKAGPPVIEGGTATCLGLGDATRYQGHRPPSPLTICTVAS